MKQLRILVAGVLLSTLLTRADLFLGLAQCKDIAYRRDIYPFDQSLITDLIKGIHTVSEPHAYIRGVLKLFINIAKGAPCIDSESFSNVLQCFIDILPPYFTPNKLHANLHYSVGQQLDQFERLKQLNVSLLVHELSNRYTDFRSDPMSFIDGLAQQLALIGQTEIEIAKLRFTLMAFLEIHISKCIWSTDDQDSTWELTKKMADLCTMLVEKGILDDLNDLDDIFWTLIHRYGHFLDLTCFLLNDSVFHAIKQDINYGNLLLFSLEEQDNCIPKRAECLLDTVMFAEAKKKASEKGLIGH